MSEVLRGVVDAKFSFLKDDRKTMNELGVELGKLYTDHGLPIDMALGKLEATKNQKINILEGALWWLVEHRRQSGATDKAVERQRKSNRDAMERFVDSGESGIY